MIGKGHLDRYLGDTEVQQIVDQAAQSAIFSGKRVLVIIPDSTRTMPMPFMFRALEESLRPRTAALDYLVALGTHPPMTDAQLSRHIGSPVSNGHSGPAKVLNHRWDLPETFIQLGHVSSSEISRLTEGRMNCDVRVAANRLLLEYDHLLICGPVFPHEVVGFSGGNKYLFPGVAGAEIINFTHWLGAIITNYDVIGAGYTPVRAVIDRAAQCIPRPKSCFALVVTKDGIAGMYFGTPEEAWQSASELSSRKHIVWIDRPFQRVLSVLPDLYDDLWTGAKGMYKLEPAVADGGEIVIFAPNLAEISYTHGKLIDELGYHCRDYFVKQWDRFKHYPGGVLAHSTHLRGLGSYDSERAIESLRIKVTLATGIPEERCRRVNLGFCDPGSVNLNDWKGREAEGIAIIPRAGETLYRVKKP